MNQSPRRIARGPLSRRLRPAAARTGSSSDSVLKDQVVQDVVAKLELDGSLADLLAATIDDWMKVKKSTRSKSVDEPGSCETKAIEIKDEIKTEPEEVFVIDSDTGTDLTAEEKRFVDKMLSSSKAVEKQGRGLFPLAIKTSTTPLDTKPPRRILQAVRPKQIIETPGDKKAAKTVTTKSKAASAGIIVASALAGKGVASASAGKDVASASSLKRKADATTEGNSGTGAQVSKRRRLTTDPGSAYTVFISNIPQQMCLDELSWHLDQRQAVPLKVFRRGNGTFAFLVYRSPSEAHLALHRLRNLYIKNKKIFLQLSRTNTLGRFSETWESPQSSNSYYPAARHIHHFHYHFQ